MVEIPPPAQRTVDAIWAAREAEHKARPPYESYGISASSLGHDCDRKLWYSLRWASLPEQFTGRKLRIFERGDIEEQRILDDLRLAGVEVEDVDPVTGRQWRFALANGFLRGKADGRAIGIIEAPKTEHVIEIKSMKAADWRAIVKHGLARKKPEHWHQLHAGMVGLGLTRGAYIAVNKDSEEIHIERIALDVEEGNRQEARVLRIVDAHDAPGRIADSDETFACRFCQHKALCHSPEFARRHCRTCVHFTFTRDGNGHCDRFNVPHSPQEQRNGASCPAHLFLPALVPGVQVDANPDEEWIEYELPDGTTWRDGKESRNA